MLTDFVPATTPDPIGDALELNLFEKLVYKSTSLLNLFPEHTHLFALVSFFWIVAIWAIFYYHKEVIRDCYYFIDHVDTAGRFNTKTFDFFMWLSTVFPPMGGCVLVFSVVTRFNTERFIALFATRVSRL